MDRSKLSKYSEVQDAFRRVCQEGGWNAADDSVVSPNGWLRISLTHKVIDASDDPIVSAVELIYRWEKDPLGNLDDLAAIYTAADYGSHIQRYMKFANGLHVQWPGKLSAAQKRIVNLLRDGHRIERKSSYSVRVPDRSYCNGVKLSCAALTKLREFGVISGSSLVRLPDPDPVQ